MDSPECGVRVLTTIQCLYTLTTRNGADKSASCTIKVLSTTMQPRHFCRFVGFFNVLRFVCGYSREENIPDMFIGCQRVFLIGTCGRLEGGEKTCLLFLFIWVCKTEQ